MQLKFPMVGEASAGGADFGEMAPMGKGYAAFSGQAALAALK